MDRIFTILRYASRANWRAFRNIRSISGNNLAIFSLVLISGGGFLYVVLGMILLIPLTKGSLSTLPAGLLKSWPLKRSSIVWLRLLSFITTPLGWIAIAVVLSTGRLILAGLLIVVAVVLTAVLSISGDLLNRITRPVLLQTRAFAASPFGFLLIKDIRAICQTLDFYCALVLASSGVVYRFVEPAPLPEAIDGVSILVALALSACGQVMFGLEGRGGLDRMLLTPLASWIYLASKGLAIVACVLVLTALLSPIIAVAACLAALATGQGRSVSHFVPRSPWEFAEGAYWPEGITQTCVLFFTGMGVRRTGWPVFVVACLVYLVSTWYWSNRLRVRLLAS